MSKKANPTLVGGFVLTAIGLIVAGVVFLGHFKFKSEELHCVAYFSGSMHGLDIGAPVAFRGVTIGRVSGIQLGFDSQLKEYVIPVFIDIKPSPGQLNKIGEAPSPEQMRDMLQNFIDRGMRAQLKINSLLTGKLYVDLAFYQGSELRLHNRDRHLFEIPTQASGLEQITQQLENMPLSEILSKAANALDSIDNLINSEETAQAMKSLGTTLSRIEDILTTTDKELPELADELKKGLKNFSALAASANTFMRSMDKGLGPGGEELRHLLVRLDESATSFNKILNNLDGMTGRDSVYTYQLFNTLREMEKAAAALKSLSGYLQQAPDAVLFGRGEDKK